MADAEEQTGEEYAQGFSALFVGEHLVPSCLEVAAIEVFFREGDEQELCEYQHEDAAIYFVVVGPVKPEGCALDMDIPEPCAQTDGYEEDGDNGEPF